MKALKTCCNLYSIIMYDTYRWCMIGSKLKVAPFKYIFCPKCKKEKKGGKFTR